MSKVITFSRFYPSYHPRKGEQTYFVEKIVCGLVAADIQGTELIKSLRDLGLIKIENLTDWYKYHTIRGGHRFKEGDWFSPRVWSGKPYNSKQIILAPDIQVKKVWDFDAEGTDFYLSGKHELVHPEGFDFSQVEKNDGLNAGELFDWICLTPEFKKTNLFSGQIICWNDKINY